MQRTCSLTLLAATTLAALAGIAANAQTYAFTELGVLNPARPYALATGINNAGQVSGSAATNTDRLAVSNYRAFRITPTTNAFGQPAWFVDANNDGINDLMQVLPLPNSSWAYSVSRGINASGQISGTAQSSGSQSPQVAVIWSTSGAPTSLASTQVSTNGYGLNDGGDVVGNYWNPKQRSSPILPYLWQFSNGSYTAAPLGVPAPYTGGTAYAVNNLRQVVGMLSGPNSIQAFFSWTPAQGTSLLSGIALQGGGDGTVGSELINQAGIIAGAGASPNDPNHLLLMVPPGAGAAYGLTDGLNDLGSGTWASVVPYGLNNPPSGQPLRVVGLARDAAGNLRAFVWDSASRAFQDLNALTMNLPAGWVLQTARGINDLGQIVGSVTYNGTGRAFVLTSQ